MSEKIKNLIELILGGEWGNPEGTFGGINTGVIRSANFTKDHQLNEKTIAIRSIPEKKRHQKLLQTGDILIEKSGGTPDQPVGRVLFYDLLGNHTCSNFISLIRPLSTVDSKFLYYAFCELYNLGIVKGFQQQTTGIINLQLNEYLNERIFCPPLSEQKKIVEILSGIDEMIYKINLAIKKLQNLKKATLQKLLRVGINHISFKNSVSGEIPECWNVCRLGQICEFTQGVQIPLDQTIREQKSGFIRYLYIKDFSSDKKKLFVENKFPKKIISKNDLVMANTGHTAGTIFYGKEGVLSNNAFKISTHKKVNKDYLYYYLSTDEYWLEIRRLFNTAGQPHVGHSNIANIKVLFPPLEEQEKIVSIVKSIELNLSKKNAKALQLIYLKKSLMQDLLSGRKR